MAEGGGLLNRYTLSRRIEGSNPSVSAMSEENFPTRGARRANLGSPHWRSAPNPAGEACSLTPFCRNRGYSLTGWRPDLLHCTSSARGSR